MLAWAPGEEAPAKRLAALLKAQAGPIDVHHFPDGESRVVAPASAPTTMIYCSLNDPNRKLIELLLAASAFRDAGVRRLVLVAPYLCYMRQDVAFASGEAVSQRVIGRLLAGAFDRLITIEPHLHRTFALSDIFPGSEATALSVTPLFADLVKGDGAGDLIIVGPDVEARRWTQSLAEALDAPFTLFEKMRSGDAEVRLTRKDDEALRDRRVYIVDDIVSSGATLIEATRRLRLLGAREIHILVVHALMPESALRQLKAAGAASVRSTDTVAHATNSVSVAPLLASALAGELNRKTGSARDAEERRPDPE
jgi:ribose-phosphate pyrophosphokinase